MYIYVYMSMYIYMYVYIYIYIYIRYPAQTITDIDYADDIVLLTNTLAQAEFGLHSVEKAAGGIRPHVDAEETKYICFNQNQRGNISGTRANKNYFK